MAFFLSKGFIFPRWTPAIKFTRNKSKVNITKPKHPHFKRDVVLQVCQPFIPDVNANLRLVDYCQKEYEDNFFKPTEINPYEIILARELRNWFKHSQMVMFFHLNSMVYEDLRKAKLHFLRKGMTAESYGKGVVHRAVHNTGYEPILDVIVSSNIMLFSPYVDINTVLKINKKIPQFILLAGIIENNFLSHSQLLKLSKIPNLAVAQSELVSTLKSSAMALHQNLNFHQQRLVGQLEQYVEMKQKPEETTVEVESPEKTAV